MAELPSSWPREGPVLMLLMARGLEDVALRALQGCIQKAYRPLDPAHIHQDSCQESGSCPRAHRSVLSVVLPEVSDQHLAALAATEADDAWPCASPVGEEGEAFVGKALLRLDAFGRQQRRQLLRLAMSSGLFQGALAFVAAKDVESSGARVGRGAETQFQGSLAQVEALVASSPCWVAARTLHSEAQALLGRPGSRPGRQSFRASCVRDGRHKGFRCQDVMAAMGAGALQANGDLDIALYDYEMELLGFLSGPIFACGIWLGPEWRVNSRGEIQKGPERNFHVVPVGDRRGYLPFDVRNLPRLRPSTALALLNLAKPRTGERLLDPFGGVGTIAVEAACRFPGLICISSDKDATACHTAAAHCQLAKKLGALQIGSSLEHRRWDARKLKLEDNSVNLIVSDLPFLNRCDFDFDGSQGARQGLAAVLREMARVLAGSGRAVLLVQSRHMLEDALRYSAGCGLELQESCQGQRNPRAVLIGGAACWVFLLHQVKPSAEPRGVKQPFRKRQGAPPAGYVCRCCELPGHWRDRCPVQRTPAAQLARRATI
ncbi:unnamed protein product [Effrenium voratum]|uniref:Ribosomal RNA large subunit methyltransferase K/L-like methyltransferase domain-containing protein n=1 Tax=Effrenium voratum TaxID=2562239 RepID=A0AA36NB38_9DINO|nr:unnamed protein product [Effrenium voratum]